MLNKKALSGTAAAEPGWDLKDATWPGTITWYDFGQTGSNLSLYPTGLTFKTDGTKMYLVGAKDSGSPADAVYEFDLSTAWDVSTASYLQNYQIGISGRDTFPQGMYFKSDGTKFYIAGTNNDAIEEYDLSTAWDITTSSFNQSFSVATEDGVPRDVFFKTDGTKMYVPGVIGDDINEYNLTTAWDISTASFNQSFSVSTQETNPSGLFFKDDGTKMYISGTTGDDVNEYDLSTAWDISTATYNQNFSVSSQTTNPTGLFFKPDGRRMWISESSTDTILQYSLGTAWDISSASYVRDFDVSGQELTPNAIAFKDDGTKMYMTGFIYKSVWSYDLV